MPLVLLLRKTAPNRVDIIRFGPKGVLTALKRVYLVKRNLNIYSVGTFSPIRCGMSHIICLIFFKCIALVVKTSYSL